MILTENQASTKWCPFSTPGYASDCKASGCAAWRWYDGGSDEQPRRGYCGLAGKPEVAG